MRVQVEIDFKAECKAGDAIALRGSRGPTDGALASNGAGPDALSFVHVLERTNGEVKEIVRARSTWRAGSP